MARAVEERTTSYRTRGGDERVDRVQWAWSRWGQQTRPSGPYRRVASGGSAGSWEVLRDEASSAASAGKPGRARSDRGDHGSG